MLKALYTEFDNYCGLLDIYKIETIGDAYVVAGGLHKSSHFHCLQVAWMSLLMMEASARNYTPKGVEIKMRIGLHSGEVLAGIVGVKQPRYCLFGNNCAIANKFESNSEEKRIHLSPVTKWYKQQLKIYIGELFKRFYFLLFKRIICFVFFVLFKFDGKVRRI